MISCGPAQQDPQKIFLHSSFLGSQCPACAVARVFPSQMKTFKFILIDLLYVLAVPLFQQVLDAFEWQRSPTVHLMLPLEQCHLKLDGNTLIPHKDIE